MLLKTRRQRCQAACETPVAPHPQHHWTRAQQGCQQAGIAPAGVAAWQGMNPHACRARQTGVAVAELAINKHAACVTSWHECVCQAARPANSCCTPLWHRQWKLRPTITTAASPAPPLPSTHQPGCSCPQQKLPSWVLLQLCLIQQVLSIRHVALCIPEPCSCCCAVVGGVTAAGVGGCWWWW